MEWKTQRYEGSVGVDGRWVVSRSEAEARAEAAERNASKLDNDLEAADSALDDERREVARLQARIEAAERQLEERMKPRRELQQRAEAAERERDNAIFYEGRTAAKLAAVREVWDRWNESWADGRAGEDANDVMAEIGAILDREGEK